MEKFKTVELKKIQFEFSLILLTAKYWCSVLNNLVYTSKKFRNLADLSSCVRRVDCEYSGQHHPCL